jgi:hypothetical protein
MNKILTTLVWVGILLGMGGNLFAGPNKSEGLPYLPVVGPPPLRYEAKPVENPLILAELALPKPQVFEPEMLPLAPLTGDQSSDVAPSAGANVAGNPAGIFPGPAINSEYGTNPASGMLNLTPKMIAEYLKSNRESHDGNEQSPFEPGQSILVPAELGFVPPMPSGDRAVYNSK